MSWTKWDLTLVTLALSVAFVIAGYRGWQHYQLEKAAIEVTTNVFEVAGSVKDFRSKTGQWFPASNGESARVRIYPDPFSPDARPYQGLETELLSRDKNTGLTLQLVRFEPSKDRLFPIHLFDTPYQKDEPYLRVLLSYGRLGQVETEIMMRVQSKLPPGSLGEIDDHYYVIDMRKLINDG